MEFSSILPRLILASNVYYSELYAGAVDYVRRRTWMLDATMLCFPGAMPTTERAIGILACATQRSLLEWVVAQDLPVVHLLHTPLQVPPWPRVMCDWEAVGRLGARHLLELGNVHFAFYRFVGWPDVNECHDGFVQEITAHGHPVHELDSGRCPAEEMQCITTGAQRVEWLTSQLRSLPRPLAVMSADDRFAVDLVLAARGLKLRIPEDIAILGAEDQPLIRGVVPEEISSVDLNFREVARLGSELLDRMLQGSIAGSKDVPMLVKVQPKAVIARQSTATFTCGHPGVTSAARFVRQHFSEPITVADVASSAAMSVRSLQTEYPLRVGRTVKEDILSARLKCARSLLEHTDLKLAAVAVESGFGNTEYLCRIFQSKYHLTPRAWRLQHRPFH